MVGSVTEVEGDCWPLYQCWALGGPVCMLQPPHLCPPEGSIDGYQSARLCRGRTFLAAPPPLYPTGSSLHPPSWPPCAGPLSAPGCSACPGHTAPEQSTSPRPRCRCRCRAHERRSRKRGWGRGRGTCRSARWRDHGWTWLSAKTGGDGPGGQDSRPGSSRSIPGLGGSGEGHWGQTLKEAGLGNSDLIRSSC